MTAKNMILVGLFAFSAVGVAGGAELRLKTQARCATGIVRLSDVAEIHTAEDWQKEQLGAIELGPAPTTGSRRFIRSREVQDALWMRGINLSLHQISGSDRIEVIGPGEPAAAAKPTARIDDSTRDRAKRTITEAISRLLHEQAGARQPWQVSVQPTDEQVTALGLSGRRVIAQGGSAPWTGQQRFTITVESGEVAQSFAIDADVSLPPGVVTAVRTLPAGMVLHETDLVVKPVASLGDDVQPFYRLEDVVGKQTTWPIAAGAVFTAENIRRPVVVRRGDAVTLYARSAGLRVRTTVRAREDGGAGDLIAVESLTDRKAFYARVTGIQEAEIYAAPADAAAPQPASDAALRTSSIAGGVIR